MIIHYSNNPFRVYSQSFLHNIGGIVGSGILETLHPSASTVSGYYSMVDFSSAQQYFGAASGVLSGSYLENGQAYRLEKLFPDYSDLLGLIVPLYLGMEFAEALLADHRGAEHLLHQLPQWQACLVTASPPPR